MASVYFPAATAPAWGNPYTVKLQGNPAAFTMPLRISLDLQGTDYCSDCADPVAARQALTRFLRTQALLLQYSMGVTLIQVSQLGNVLTLAGETYFSSAIPGLAVMSRWSL